MKENKSAELNVDAILKFLLVGNGKSKKSTVLNKFCNTQPNTVEVGVDYNYKIVEVNGTSVKFQVWDIPGEERYRSMIESYFRETHGIFLVFNCEDLQSFLDIEQWLKLCHKHATGKVKVMLMGVYEDKANMAVDSSTIQKFTKQTKLDCVVVDLTALENLNEAFIQFGIKVINDMPELQAEVPKKTENHRFCSMM